MIKLIIFDLDGVLVSSKDTHYNALNEALVENGFPPVQYEEHLKHFDGLPTYKKLDKLGIDKKYHKKIWESKQKTTIDYIYKEIKPDIKLIDIFARLQKEYRVYVASNSIRKTTIAYLEKLGILRYIDNFATNEDVSQSKPYPEMYWSIMTYEKVYPSETLIIEDSQVGVNAVKNSGANLLKINTPEDLTMDLIEYKIKQLEKDKHNYKWESDKMNIVIPMAGAGSRFKEAGYTFPKPLIEIHGKPMIQVVVENINIAAHYIFIVQKEHYEKYQLSYLLKNIAPKCDIIQIDGITEGAACTVLKAEKLINNDNPLFICNSDQYIEWDSSEFMYQAEAGNTDGCIPVFENTHPKWSYIKLNTEGFVTEIAEKKAISNMATTGHYYWKKGSDFVKYAKEMIKKNIRTNNEFYVAPVYNMAIENACSFTHYKVDKMYGLGIPEDLNYFLKNYKGNI